jgi:cytoskeletal protein CcmA (bactofilin family)
MFKQKQTKSAEIDTLVGANTRINGDVEFVGGFHLDGTINGNVKCAQSKSDTLSVSEHGCIEGSVFAPTVILNGIVKGDIEAANRVELGAKARVLGNVQYTVIETAVGAQINGKLIHRAAQAGSADQGAGAAIRPRADASGNKDK